MTWKETEAFELNINGQAITVAGSATETEIKYSGTDITTLKISTTKGRFIATSIEFFAK